MNTASSQANDTMTLLIDNVDPAQFNFKQYFAKLGAAITYGAIVGWVLGYVLEAATLTILTATGSGTAALIAYILGFAAIIYFVMSTCSAVADYAVDKLPGDTVGAYNAIKAKFASRTVTVDSVTTDAKTLATSWFNRARNAVTA